VLGKTQSSLKAQEEYIRSINQGLITAQSFQKSFTHYTLVHALAQSLRTITKNTTSSWLQNAAEAWTIVCTVRIFMRQVASRFKKPSGIKGP